MFEIAELGQTIEKSEYKELEPVLRTELVEMQHKLKSAGFSVLILVNGVDGAGKGDTANLLHEWMDPRFISTMAFDRPSDEERSRPVFWRYWRKLPPKGRLGIFIGSWYTDPIVKRVNKTITKSEYGRALKRINATEKMLADGDTLIIKFWLHLSKKAQKKRLKKLEKNADTRWRVTDTDWKHFKMYDRFRDISAETIQTTSTAEAPWTIIEGACPRYRGVTIARHILKRVNERLDADAPHPKPVPMKKPSRMPITILDQLDLTKTFDGDYKEALIRSQGRLNTLYRKAKDKNIACVLAFEGMDAAGKGSTIRRITPALDARDYRIIPIAAPSDEEKAHHYLWRFWRWMPPKRKIAIFDRSWYGRVLVERVEGFATRDEWRRAFAEINAFEEQIYEDGVVFLKFWLHIDPDEQLRRFKAREEIPYKRFKITEEDYRNRKKLPQYMVAANEMIEHTSTAFAPWTLVEANDKKFARLKVLDTLCDRLESALKKTPKKK